MGVWGMGIAQSDEYCEIYEDFMERYDEGVPVTEITDSILKSYLEEFDPADGVLHDVYFALAKGGLYYSDTVQFCESAGIEAEWEQNLLRRMYPDNVMRDLLDSALIPDTFRHEEVLRQRIEMARALYGDEAVKLL